MENENTSIVIEGPENMAVWRLLQLRSALGLEIKGIRLSRGFSAYAMVKREHGFKGNKQKVWEQLNALVEAKKAARGVK